MATVALAGGINQIAAAFPKSGGTKIRSVKLAAAVTAGQPVSINSSGLGQVCDSATSGTYQFKGIALSTGAIGDTISILERGEISGFALGSVAYDALIYVNDTGILGTTAGTHTIVIGRVVNLTDAPNYTKLIDVFSTPWANW